MGVNVALAASAIGSPFVNAGSLGSLLTGLAGATGRGVTTIEPATPAVGSAEPAAPTAAPRMAAPALAGAEGLRTGEGAGAGLNALAALENNDVRIAGTGTGLRGACDIVISFSRVRQLT